MRKLITVIPELTKEQRAALSAAAERHGLQALFFDTAAEAEREAEGAEILLSGDAALAARMPGLKWICTPTAGINQFVKTPPAPGTRLTNSSGAYGVTISEHILMLALELLRRQPEYTDIVNRREWKKDLPVKSLHGARITLLGTGDIGTETAKRLRAFAPESITGLNRSGSAPAGAYDRVYTCARLKAVLAGTDLLIASLPGTKETEHLLNAEALAALPDGAALINVGRGSLIDEAALEKELRAGRLKAALDVFETEPLPQNSPLWGCPGLIITPHAAGNRTLPYTVQRITELFLEDLENYAAGRPLRRAADIGKGY